MGTVLLKRTYLFLILIACHTSELDPPTRLHCPRKSSELDSDSSAEYESVLASHRHQSERLLAFTAWNTLFAHALNQKGYSPAFLNKYILLLYCIHLVVSF